MKIKGVDCMIDNYAWNVFVNTGNIDAYLLSKEIVKIKSEAPNAIINNNVEPSISNDSETNTA